ncbi:MAG: glycine cleavage system protein GcvH [Anaerolineae bacterium]|nr:glycine cleavage system protein GcvH [Anaerolineae bacterium]
MSKWNIPADLKYARSDEWVRVEGDEAVIGISDYAQDALSDIVFVELPAVGDTLEAGKRFGTIESVKAASDLNAPLDGAVTAINNALEDAPERVNGDPYGGAWMVRIRPANLAQLDNLMDAAAYEAYCEERG